MLELGEAGKRAREMGGEEKGESQDDDCAEKGSVWRDEGQHGLVVG
jgi:hypothetical protein